MNGLNLDLVCEACSQNGEKYVFNYIYLSTAMQSHYIALSPHAIIISYWYSYFFKLQDMRDLRFKRDLLLVTQV